MFRIEHCPAWGRKAEALVDDSRLSVISDATGESKVKRVGRHWGRKFQCLLRLVPGSATRRKGSMLGAAWCESSVTDTLESKEGENNG